MKKLETFKKVKISESSLSSLYGGMMKEHDTAKSEQYPNGDVWNDKDNSGTITPGDTWCPA